MATPTRHVLSILPLLTACAAAGCSPASDDGASARGEPSEASSERRWRRDADGDGYTAKPYGGDCDDTRKAVNPGATETCGTSYDDDCDGVTNERNATSCTTFYLDADNDGYGTTTSACYCSASGSYDTRTSGDCDDSSSSVNPGATEVSDDGIDQDCDGTDLTTGGGGGDTGSDTGDAPYFGFWGLNGYLSASGLADVNRRMGTTLAQLACASPSYCVGTVLPMFKAAGIHVMFRMTPGPSYYTTSGSFDITKWKNELDDWDGYDVQKYIDDGTLVGHMILDDIYNYTGTDPTAAQLDEMARYSKSKFPGLMTFVRERATRMPTPSSGKYTYVDACVNQYRARDGEIHTYATTEVAKAKSLGLGVINGLNLPDGGDGSSGQRGWRSDGTFWAMSADEITEYGTVLANVPEMGMFLSWEYDGEEAWSDGTIGADYLDRADIQAALLDLSELVGSHEPVTLLKP